MGTDIHPIVQVEHGTQWRTVTLPADVHRALRTRNYDAFAILGNVRNGSGFAGIDTGDEFEPISDGRGIPDDVGVEKDEDDYYLFGDHSYSWVTLAELLDYEWATGVIHRGTVPVNVYHAWSQYRDGPPWQYSGGVFGAGIETLNEIEYDTMATKPDVPDDKLYIRASWIERASLSAGSLYSVVMPYLKTLGPPDRVRVVFGFDS